MSDDHALQAMKMMAEIGKRLTAAGFKSDDIEIVPRYCVRVTIGDDVTYVHDREEMEGFLAAREEGALWDNTLLDGLQEDR